jgi:hypothetical protein
LGHLSYAPFSSKNSIRLFFTQIQSLYTFLLLLSVNQVAQSVSPEAQQIISQNIQNLLGILPPSNFNVSITTDRENLAGLIGSAMMTGYFIRQMETRMQLDQSLASIE